MLTHTVDSASDECHSDETPHPPHPPSYLLHKLAEGLGPAANAEIIGFGGDVDHGMRWL